ncbi:hypothetical protein CYLTODRAFT_439832 [Cylindrobasidium torrendii FP15055 ss-10]|uniref:F-box domain-containing protein n=1 Tax=Cylindrobasidium torrendii FP15055 ss-10 TaxID=1314674 RepID=A0A0D7BSN5_9AGAR|nr:hypothetical protein CYLTODRAFT_439832 [Cylindrobasidium torrendii FP15055 ss-10]
MSCLACGCSGTCTLASYAPRCSDKQKEIIAAHLSHNLSPAENTLLELELLKTKQIEYSKQLAIQIQSLLECKAELDTSIEQISQVVHPFRRLPNEILSCVFRAALPDSPTLRELFDGNLQHCIASDHPAWIFSKVCRPWREAALADSAIWADVVVDLAAITAHQASTDLLKLFMERSKNRPLRVYIYGNTDDIHSNSVQILMKSSQRWSSADIVTSRPFFWAYFDNPSTEYSRLRHISIATTNVPSQGQRRRRRGNDFPKLTSAALPSLRSLEVSDMGIMNCLGDFPFFQLRQFKHTWIPWVSKTTAGQIQSSFFKQLLNCTHVDLQFIPNGRQEDRPVELNSAMVLTLNGRSHSMAPLLKGLLAPRLQELRLSDLEGATLPDLLGDAAAIHLRFQSLRHLTISLGKNLDSNLVCVARKVFPHLKSLEVNVPMPESVPGGWLSGSLLSECLWPDDFFGANGLETFVIRSIVGRITRLPASHSTAADAQATRALAGVPEGRKLVAIDDNLSGHCSESLLREVTDTEQEPNRYFSVWCHSKLYSCRYSLAI